MSERFPPPRKEKEYPAIREMFRLAGHLSPDAVHDVLRTMPIPREAPVAEVAGERFLHEEPISEKEMIQTLEVAFGFGQEYWKSVFAKEGWEYGAETKLNIFANSVQTEDGRVFEEGFGPFFLSDNNTIYWPHGSYDTLREKLVALADRVSLTYLINHEMAHATQERLGILHKVTHAQKHASNKEGRSYINRAMEMHADYLAGCALRNAHERSNILHEGDSVRLYWALASLGDDLLYAKHGKTVPIAHIDHGTARERAGALWAGLSSGDWKSAQQYIETQLSQ